MSDVELIEVDPATLTVGANVRTDTHPDAREFAASIKARGVLEVITVYRDEEGHLVVLRGQRRTVVATEVGTPSGTVPVRVLPHPDEADRITDQISENVHREAMNQREVCDGLEQLALLGASAAQIAKRTGIARPTVKAALAVAGSESAKEAMTQEALTLDQAAILAEFDGDEAAVARLTRALQFGWSLEHEAQRLRDDAEDAAALAQEGQRLRAEGLPVLDPQEAPDLHQAGMRHLRDSAGEPIPEEDWPQVSGAAVVLQQGWDYPEPEDQDDEWVEDQDDEVAEPEAVRVYRQVWVCTDPEAAGLIHAQQLRERSGTNEPDEEQAEAAAEAKRAERRQVVENNKAWRSAQTVRREWLATFVTRKNPPKGAEALICEAVLTAPHWLNQAMSTNHPMLQELRGVEVGGYYGHSQECDRLAHEPATPKAATMRTLAAILAAWEKAGDVHTWRNPGPWDRRILSAMTEWGYGPSEIEAQTAQEPTSQASDTEAEPHDQGEVTEGQEHERSPRPDAMPADESAA